MIKTDICIIGAGSGGLSVAAGAVQMGAKVVLCEGNKMGGDCLNYGCVPSKAIIEASRIITKTNKAQDFGININSINVDYKKVQQHIKDTIAKIEPHDSVERFEALGVKVIQEYGQIIDQYTVKAGDNVIKAKYIVIATGASAIIPKIKGLDEVDYLTNETIFELKEKPKHLMIIGGGPIGVELAQAYALFGIKVTIFEASDAILGMLDSESRKIILKEFDRLAMNVITNVNISEIVQDNQEINLYCGDKLYQGSHLLIAAGRAPNLHKLNLDKTGIKYTVRGIRVDKRLRTNYKNIYAMGDVIGGYQFTHVAGYHAGIVIQNILFKLPAKVDYASLPWSIYISPEIAHVGQNIAQAQSHGATLLKLSYQNNDRAVASLATDGLIKVAVSKKGYILGATIIGENASELIVQWTIAIKNKLKIKNMTSHIVAYPTLSELNKRLAGSYFTPILYSTKVKKLVGFLMKVFGKKL
ncbi:MULTISPECIES: dihydrolipoyl dehydrogenase family protein [Francisella]|uniref:Dihydrolipoamide dehydrogenase n=1 Tax=Francisella opportunistica TaxID=2016517 RepID=A0A345JSZ5_9GAMM|nr:MULTISPECIES: FAD-dependent oxidoreductase [Francisella]APC92227.1 FAD-dependent NAD(P)-disulfide oxidoreductase [Francisella sp. MA067296]AXH30441.1 dihydrolipoamide dehydrogenase [Francisella opportunistica]AXH32082.1 dihydrolipoamide dehydrogenase [Francisella opportunistica]AXH33730.1 dihydrolipoamide dehydrogenase [Francisella opportunistica]